LGKDKKSQHEKKTNTIIDIVFEHDFSEKKYFACMMRYKRSKGKSNFRIKQDCFPFLPKN
jgi:hypothetical protein